MISHVKMWKLVFYRYLMVLPAVIMGYVTFPLETELSPVALFFSIFGGISLIYWSAYLSGSGKLKKYYERYGELPDWSAKSWDIKE